MPMYMLLKLFRIIFPILHTFQTIFMSMQNTAHLTLNTFKFVTRINITVNIIVVLMYVSMSLFHLITDGVNPGIKFMEHGVLVKDPVSVKKPHELLSCFSKAAVHGLGLFKQYVRHTVGHLIFITIY